jgi:hypothetical protein
VIRTGVDLGFDGGAAAWALGLHGCVATAGSEAAAIEALPDRVDGFVAWLAGSGEAVEPPRGSVHVVERFESYRLDDGYEVNALFAADQQPVTRDDVEAALRWLDLAHERLATVVMATGSRPLSGEGRTRVELLGHVVRAERWLATRVEPDQADIAFPPDEGPVDDQLRANRSFVRTHLLRASDGDGVRERTDSKGEGWTTRKILRRLVYHVLDHAEELERRAQEPVR